MIMKFWLVKENIINKFSKTPTLRTLWNNYTILYSTIGHGMPTRIRNRQKLVNSDDTEQSSYSALHSQSYTSKAPTLYLFFIIIFFLA